MGNCVFNFFFDTIYYFVFAVLGVFGADFGGDCETGGHGHAEQVHFCEVGAFAAKQISH